MARKVLGWVVPLGIVLLTGCSVSIQTPVETRVQAQNNLTDLLVEVDGSETDVDAIDLLDVTIGDVLFPLIEADRTTSSKITGRSGKVTVTIDEADVSTRVLGQPVTITLTDIDPMSTTITEDVTNTVVFDETTAGVIFSALAKKKAN